MHPTLLRPLLIALLLPLASLASEDSFLVATLKVMPERGNKAANYALFEQLARRAAAAGANLIVTPECYLDGYMGNPKRTKPEEMPAASESIDGPWVTKAAALARELKVHIIFGFSEKRTDGIFNTVAIFSPDGSLAGRYSKTHVVGGEFYKSGTELPVFETALGRMGVLICFDRRPPESARVLALKGAQFIVVPAYGEVSTPIDEDILMQARAQENGVYIVYTSPRNAFVVDPDGAIVSKVSGNTDELMFARLTLDERIGDNNAIRVRRPELYGRLAEPNPKSN
ncbi:MAG TPA: carbon-nitrogen hydrolase family protein [Opitutaceae bacterium]